MDPDVTESTARANTLEFRTLDSDQRLHFAHFRAVVVGYTGRDEAAIRRHIDELAEIGVAPPPQVPMFYPVEQHTMSTSTAFSFRGTNSSGEVEPAILRCDGKYFLGVGSDHTDRDLETVDIGESKRACPKPIGPVVAEIPDWESFDWDRCRARSWVDGRLYQDGSLAGLRTPTDLLATFDQRLGDDGGDLICFAGTLPVLDGTFTPGGRWDLELALPSGQTLSHTYFITTEGI